MIETTLDSEPVEAVPAEAKLFDFWASCLELPEVVDRGKWCEENLRLPAETAARAGPYDLGRHAYFREILAAVDDPEVEKIILMMATQLGKTTLLQAVLASYAALTPTPSMLVAPDKDAIVELRDRFYALCEASEPLRPLVPARQFWNNRWLDLGRMRTHLGYAMNTQRLSGKSCGLVLLTEVDRYRARKEQGGPEKLAEERVKAFTRYKIIMESTPTDEASRIHAQYLTSDERTYHVPCPRCNHFQKLRFHALKKGKLAGRGGVVGIRDKKGEFLSAEEAREGAYYRCEQGCRIEDRHKGDMVRAGRWVPKGQSIDGRGKLVGKPLKPPRIWGGQLSSIYAEHISFGRVAAEYLVSRDKIESARNFVQNWLGTIFRRQAKTPKWKQLWARLRGGHKPGSVPAWALFLTSGVDVGKDYCRWVVRAWGEGGTSALVDWGTTHMAAVRRTSHLEALEGTILVRHWPLTAPNALGQTSLETRMMLVDVGFGPHLVHGWYRTLAAKGLGKRVRQCVGRQDLKTGELWRSTVIERSARTGKVYQGGQERWEVNRALFNADIHSRWRQPIDEPGAWMFTDAKLADCDLYLRELTNEAPVSVEKKRGRSVTVWDVIDRNIGNHFFDCEVYALAAAEMIVGGDWRELVARYRTETKGRRPAARAEEPSDFSAREDRGFSAR